MELPDSGFGGSIWYCKCGFGDPMQICVEKDIVLQFKL